ncbi:MAG: hypothetical protein CMB80_01035 [Flammeovirgaceae bacterium]|nr:hypothetical protein [Flammeovirgaceae bacterium]
MLLLAQRHASTAKRQKNIIAITTFGQLAPYESFIGTNQEILPVKTKLEMNIIMEQNTKGIRLLAI